MNILFCNYEYPPLGGGGGVFNKQIAEELAKRHSVTVLTSQGMALPYYRVENQVKIYRVPVYFRSRLAAANMLSMLAYLPNGYIHGKKILRSESFDVINTHFVLPTGPVGDWLSRLARIPNVLTVQGGDLYDPSKWSSPHRHRFLRKSVRKLLGRADAVIAASNNSVKNVHDFYIPDLQCEFVPLGMERQEDVAVAHRSRYGISDDDIALVSVGRLVSRKAFDQLITVVKQLENKKVHLFIIGSGPQEEALLRLASDPDISDQIHLLGQVEDQEKYEVLRMADIYVSTSQHEGFGIVYLEGMASHLPVVCYDYGGQTDFLTDGKTGHLVKLNDLDAFVQACRTIIDNAGLREQMSEYNVNAVESFYIENVANTYEKIFEAAIDKRKAET